MRKKKNLLSPLSAIIVRGAREHNLKDITVSFPKNALTVITGPSGSGKSSLAFDVLYEEGRRRYVDSLSSYARQFLGPSRRPLVDSIEGLCPAIAIEQKTISANPRSTVGTVTEIYDYLRVLFARIGKAHCVNCGVLVHAESAERIAEMIALQQSEKAIEVLAPVVRKKKGEFCTTLERLFISGYYRMRIDSVWYKFNTKDELKALDLKKTIVHSIDILVDEIENPTQERSRLQAAIETAFNISSGLVIIVYGENETIYARDRLCVGCNQSVAELEPRSFSFNSLLGACKACQGIGYIQEWHNYGTDFISKADRWRSDVRLCHDCRGARLNKQALSVLIAGHSIAQLSEMKIDALKNFFITLNLDSTEAIVAKIILQEIMSRIEFLILVGLSYVTLSRSSGSLSGGEGQRIRLASQIGSMLSGVLYVLDEPSIGLHQKDNDRLIGVLQKLRDIGNTVLVVEHDMDTISQADYVIDMGPAAGVGGGQVVAAQEPDALKDNPLSLTGLFLSGKRNIAIPQKRRVSKHFLCIKHANKHNLKDISVALPLFCIVGISGVSGSGKSTLIMQELVPALKKKLEKLPEGILDTVEIFGWENHIKALVVVDQSPIGRTSRSNVATYLGIFDEIRRLYAGLPESQARGYSVGRFSFNTQEGRCDECKGDGFVTFEMHFLPAVTVECKVCKGKRYNKAVLEIAYKGKSIFDCLSMTASQAFEFFAHHRSIARRLSLLIDVGLGYLTLGQPSTTFSGGEAQRIKLVDELAKRGKDTLYVLDEPTTGLHNSDIEQLLVVLNRLVDKGNSMIIIEHNLDVLKTVDYCIDLGPEGGDHGGMIVGQGTPEQLAHVQNSFTGLYLKKYFNFKDMK